MDGGCRAPKTPLDVWEILCTWHVIFQTLEPTRVSWKSDRARADEVRQAYVY